MSAEILHWNGVTQFDIPADTVLEESAAENLNNIFVMGYRADGTLFVSTSSSDFAEINLMLDRVKKRLVDHMEDGE